MSSTFINLITWLVAANHTQFPASTLQSPGALDELQQQQSLLKQHIEQYQGDTEEKKRKELEASLKAVDFFCNGLSNNNVSPSLHVLAMNYLLGQWAGLPLVGRIISGQKIGQLFADFMKCSPDKARAFYVEKQDLINKAFPSCKILVAQEQESSVIDKERIAKLQNELSIHLVHEKTPYTLLTLLSQHYVDVEERVAVVLFLLAHGVTVVDFIKHPFFHHFLMIHVNTLDAEDNDVGKFYEILGRYPQAQELIRACEQTYIALPAYAVPFSLTGQKKINYPLAECSKAEDSPFYFTINEANFSALYNAFGRLFLQEALLLLKRHDNVLLSNLVQTALQNMTDVELSYFIIEMGRQEAHQALEVLSGLVTLDRVNGLITKQNGAVLYLAPFKPELFARLSSEVMSGYIQKLRDESTSGIELIGQFSSMLQAIGNRNPITQKQVFAAILELIMAEPQLVDINVQRLLAGFVPLNAEILAKKITSLHRQLLEKIISEVTKFNDFSPAVLSRVEDMHHTLLVQVNGLLSVYPHRTNFPTSRLALYAEIATTCLLRPDFDLKSYMEQFIPQETTANRQELSNYERVLAVCLLRARSQAQLDLIINLLEQTPQKNNKWARINYAYGSLIENAVHYGNELLVQNLLPRVLPEDVTKALTLALRERRFEMIAPLVHGVVPGCLTWRNYTVMIERLQPADQAVAWGQLLRYVALQYPQYLAPQLNSLLFFDKTLQISILHQRVQGEQTILHRAVRDPQCTRGLQYIINSISTREQRAILLAPISNDWDCLQEMLQNSSLAQLYEAFNLSQLSAANKAVILPQLKNHWLEVIQYSYRDMASFTTMLTTLPVQEQAAWCSGEEVRYLLLNAVRHKLQLESLITLMRQALPKDQAIFCQQAISSGKNALMIAADEYSAAVPLILTLVGRLPQEEQVKIFVKTSGHKLNCLLYAAKGRSDTLQLLMQSINKLAPDAQEHIYRTTKGLINTTQPWAEQLGTLLDTELHRLAQLKTTTTAMTINPALVGLFKRELAEDDKTDRTDLSKKNKFF